ncbi:DEAD/DEAH box helicase [Rufibacter soli]
MSNLPQLRDYQLNALALLNQGILDGHRAQLLVLPTGAGKTTVAGQMIHNTTAKGNHVLFMAHRKELVDQAKNRLHSFGIHPGVIMAGWKHRKDRAVNVASVQTLIKRELPHATVIVVDECHHSTSGSFKKILDQYPNAFIVGLTATPYRLDGKGLGSVGYTNIVAPISLGELTEQGHLVPARYIGVPKDMSDVATKGGDYDVHQMHMKFDKAELYDEVVEKYNSFAPGTKAIVFNVDVKHSESMRDRFLSAGISCAHVDGETSPVERNKILAAFRDGKYQVLCNVNILTEGFDLPAIETVILNRSTKSKSLYLQMVGRGLRPAPGKRHCTVLDHGGNVWNHGPVDAPDEYTLEDVPKKKAQQAAPVKECPQCFFIQHVGARHCKECDHQFTLHITERELPKAEFMELDDFLPKGAKIKIPLPDHLRKSYMDMTKEELQEVAEIRGYKKGFVWLWQQKQKEKVAA